MSRLRLTVRARLTLLYIGLFAVCGAIVVAVSYGQVAQLPARPHGNGPPQSAAGLARFAAQCRSQEQLVHPDAQILAKCAAYFQQQGAQGQRALTLSHLLHYSLITLAVVVALICGLFMSLKYVSLPWRQGTSPCEPDWITRTWPIWV